MKYLLKYIFIVISLVFSQLDFILHAQQSVRKNIRVGIEYGSYCTANNGGYTSQPGFLLGYFTGVPLSTDPNNSMYLGIEFNFKNTILYNPGVSHIICDRYKYQNTYDEKYNISTVEIGLLPEYRFVLNKNIVVGIYAGGAVGIGMYTQQHNLISHIRIDTVQYSQWLLDGPYDGNNLPFIGTYNINCGTNIYYDWLVIDVRFSFLNDVMNHSSKRINQFYILFGVVL